MPPDQAVNVDDGIAVPSPPDAGGLSPEEMKFFETGDATTLPNAYIPKTDPAPQAAEPAPAAVAPPEPAPAPKVEPQAPAPDLARALAEQQQAFQRQMSEMQARLDKALTPPEDPGPDEYSDPIGAQLHKLNKLTQEMNSLRADMTRQQEQAAQQRLFTEFVESIKADKAAFMKTAPDFNDAYAHIRAVRTEDLRAAGCPEADIPNVLQQDEFQLAAAARQRGVSPSQQMYEMAKRYGYTAKAPVAQAAQRNPEEHVARLANGQFAAKTPPAATPTPDFSLEALRDAGTSDIDKIVMNDGLWNQFIGGYGPDIFPH